MSDIPPAIQTRLDALAAVDSRHEAAIRKLERDMTEIRDILGQTATKEDISGLSMHVSTQINGILRDALNAAPMKQSVFWGALVALATIGMMLEALLHH